jgi:hypothetical protein
MNVLQQVLALIFKRKGKGMLSEKEFVFSASIDFRWYTPKEAQRLLERGLETELLERSDELIRPTFDYKKVELPLDFKPDKDILTEPSNGSEPLFPTILETVCQESGLNRREVVARINKVKERLGVDIEVAGLVVASDLEIDIHGLIPRAKEEIISR